MSLVPLVNNILGPLTILGGALTLIAIFILLTKNRSPKLDYFLNKAVLFAFLVALLATLGSLFYSEIAGYEPCKLCWFQRIFMYPQALLLGLALAKKDKNIIGYSLVMSGVGGVIAGYHYLLQLGVAPALPCAAVGYSAACSQRFVLLFGYITIPMMAFTAFALLFVTMLLARRQATTAASAQIN